MNSRRKFLQLLGLAPAAALAPKMLESGKPTNNSVALLNALTRAEMPMHCVAQDVRPMRYLGLAQLKNEGDPVSFDPGDPHFEDEISRFSRLGRKEWSDNDWEELDS